MIGQQTAPQEKIVPQSCRLTVETWCDLLEISQVFLGGRDCRWVDEILDPTCIARLP